ncbi:hypothetical protein TNCV_1508661 [Trichonephila clavipes]|nr:hypothetical protein TNCV_1508661 [Trichonephila clavipes]
MSAEETRIHDMKSSPVPTGVSHTSDFRWLHRKKSKGVRFGKREGQTTYPSLPIYHPVSVAWIYEILYPSTLVCVPLRSEVILSMEELNLDQAPQDINEEQFQLERLRL